MSASGGEAVVPPAIAIIALTAEGRLPTGDEASEMA